MVIIETIESENKKTTFRLGKNQTENDELITDADPNDWWFHLDGHSSGHCIVEINVGDSLLGEDIGFACDLIKSNCKLKNSNKKLKYVYTQIKNLTKTKIKGMVNVGNPKYILI
jgi:predicted ribosome quality control (RQC) complex YloA/Tae2 family protein